MLRKLVATLGVLVLPLLLGLPACGTDDGGPDKPAGSGGSGAQAGDGGTGATGGGGQGICLLNNCTADDHCTGCSYGRTKCDLATNRCIACDPVSGAGCPEGQVCSSYGTCQDPSLSCETDASGQPTVQCTKSADCQGCDPAHRICDTTTSKCVACTETNTSECSPSDICVDNQCARKCPESCSSDNDCGRCETGEGPLKGCFNHVCSECSDTWACAAGQQCDKGKCVKPCGLPGSTPGTCTIDSDCGACGDPTSGAAWKCKKPINGGTHGTCGPPAAGCSDLGQSTVVLPAPFDKVTNTCSKDTDCSGVGIQYNVGALIRKLVGSDEIDLGFDKVKINDASVFYGMNSCASIKLSESVSCGLCVPCKQDSDCQKIQLDPLMKSIFKDDPLISIAAGFLLDFLYGSNKDHSLHFQCLPVAAGYGACVPCANPTKACGQTSSPGTGSCSHDVCTTGGPLNTSCGNCAAEVCKNDSFCCNSSWDSLCVKAVDKYCAGGCGGATTGCAHDPCTVGVALSPLCSACVKAVCDKDGFCCNTQSGSWDQLCVDTAKATTECASACSGGCAHSECSLGGPLTPSCSSCAAAVCAGDDYCCTTDWDSYCVADAQKSSSCSC
jgi:hypothetical protein